MGCHTWFARPVKNEELELFKKYAVQDAWYLYGDTKENRENNFVDMNKYYHVVNSVENNTDYWWKNNFGTTIRIGNEEKSEYTYVINDILYLDLTEPCNPIFYNQKRYHDIFRVENYPKKIIHNRKELRKWLRKKYFRLDEKQLSEITDFFKENPGGIIKFG